MTLRRFPHPVFVTALLLSAPYAGVQAQQAPLKSGSYRCFTTSSVPVAAVDPRDPNWRKANGLPPLERGERAVPQVQMPPVMIMPAFFGNIEVDASRNYRLTRSGHTGRVGFDRATSTPTFTGDLKIMQVRGYSTSPFRFFLVYQSLAFECGLQTDDSASPAPAAAPTARAGDSTRGAAVPARTELSGPALFTGHFEGTYTCASTIALQLDLRAEPNGSLTAVFTGGGTNGFARERYSLTGTWSNHSFSLDPEKAIETPPRAVMTALSGVVTDGHILGRVVYPGCGRFEVDRK
jgi:hypothetical protein